MLGSYVTTKESFEAWLAKTSWLQGPEKGGYAAIDDRTIVYQKDTGPYWVLYTFSFKPATGKIGSTSGLALRFSVRTDGDFERPSACVAVETIRVDGFSKGEPGQRLGPGEPARFDRVPAHVAATVEQALSDDLMLTKLLSDILDAVSAATTNKP